MTMTTSNHVRWILIATVVSCAVPLGCTRPVDLGAVANSDTATKIRDALGGEGGAGEAAAGPVGTGWATLKGKFTFDGPAPSMPPYAANKDMEVCAPGGQPRSQEYLVVDGSGGLANVVIFARNASRIHESAEPGTDPLIFDQKDCVFLTHVVAIPVGVNVEIKNSDPVGHNTKIDGSSFNSMIPSNGTMLYSAQKEQAMPVGVHCSVHPWMLAYMLPRKNLYFAVTAPDGSFEIPNLPAGEELELQVWHEHAAGAQGALVLETDAAKELKWSKKGRIKIKLEENETREMNIAAPPAAFKPA
jgi:hypothetical protein